MIAVRRRCYEGSDYAPHDQLLAAALRLKAAALRDELAGPTPTPLERLAVTRVVAAWLHLWEVEGECSRAKGNDVENGSFWLKREAQSQRMYELTLRSLVMVQKLRPAAADTSGQLGAPSPTPQSAPPAVVA